jgi:hypothetical protein
MDAPTFQSLCAHVEANGFLHPVVIDDEDLLIDGRARIQVGWAITLDPSIVRHNPPNTTAYVTGCNYARTSLTDEQIQNVLERVRQIRGRAAREPEQTQCVKLHPVTEAEPVKTQLELL